MNIAIRTVLELIVMFTLLWGVLKLHDDWKLIEPPGWRFIIAGFLFVIAGNAVALLWAITENKPLTWATWVLAVAYMILLTSLAGAHTRILVTRSQS